MIVDKIQNFERYVKLVKGGEKIAKYFVNNNALTSFAQTKEKLLIPGTDYSFFPYEIETGNPEEKRWEIHRKHIDIHIVLKGKEYIEWLPVELLKKPTEYKSDLDVEFFADTVKGSSVMLELGYFCLCMPEDAHKPSIKGDGAGGIKILIKAIAL